MTTNTTKDHGPEARSNKPIESAIASKTEPGLGVAQVASEPDLEGRIGARRVALVAKLRELRADMHLEAMDAGDQVNEKLSELARILKEAAVDGWGSLGGKVKRKLERWLAEAVRHLPIQSVPAKAGQS
jgi:hypothetical protein